MGYWGWRRLMAVFVSVWVVGCSATHDDAPTVPPTEQPQLTLTVHMPATSPPPARPILPQEPPEPPQTPTPLVYTLARGDTLLSIARAFGVPLSTLQAANAGLDPRSLPIGQVIVVPNPQFDPSGAPMLPTLTPLPLDTPPPACYETATESVLCLGQVFNHRAQPVERVTLRVRLWGLDGRLLAEAAAGIEQAAIPPGGRAPYRALLRADWGAVAGATAALLSADAAPGTRTPAALAIEDERGGWVGDRYAVSAALRNTTGQPVTIRRAVLTLLDEAGQVAGYRVLEVNQTLAAGQSLPLALEAVPHAAGRALTHALYVEAG